MRERPVSCKSSHWDCTLAPTPTSLPVGSRRPAATLALPASLVASEDRVVSQKPAAENDEHAVVSTRLEQDDAAAGQRRKALLDDMPLSLKRRMYEDDPAGAQKLVQSSGTQVAMIGLMKTPFVDSAPSRTRSCLGGAFMICLVVVWTITSDTRPRIDCEFCFPPRVLSSLLTTRSRGRLRKWTRNGSAALSFTRTGQSAMKSAKSTLTRGLAR